MAGKSTPINRGLNGKQLYKFGDSPGSRLHVCIYLRKSSKLEKNSVFRGSNMWDNPACRSVWVFTYVSQLVYTNNIKQYPLVI